LALAEILALGGDDEGQLRQYERAAAAVPDSVRVLRSWANALANRAVGQANANDAEHFFRIAEEKLARAAALNPWDPEPLIEWGWLLLRRRDADRACERFSRAVRIDRHTWQGWFGKGRALAALDRHRRAIRAYRRALVHGPEAQVAKDLNISLEALRRRGAM